MGEMRSSRLSGGGGGSEPNRIAFFQALNRSRKPAPALPPACPSHREGGAHVRRNCVHEAAHGKHHDKDVEERGDGGENVEGTHFLE